MAEVPAGPGVERGTSGGVVTAPPIKDVQGLSEVVAQQRAETTKKDQAAKETRETVSGTPAEGMDKDPRYETVRKELEAEWLARHPGEDFLTEEGQNYNLGYIDPDKQGLPTLKSDADKRFRDKYPEDAKGYDIKEESRVYEDSEADPAVRKVKRDALDALNSDPEVKANRGNQSVYFAVSRRETNNAWERFVYKYPDKAKAYAAKGHPDIKGALERQEARRQEQERQAAILAQQKTEAVQAPSGDVKDTDPNAQAEVASPVPEQPPVQESKDEAGPQSSANSEALTLDLSDPNKLKAAIYASSLTDEQKASAWKAIVKEMEQKKPKTALELLLLIMTTIIQETVGLVIPRGH